MPLKTIINCSRILGRDKFTTPESYDSFISVQGMMTANEKGASNFTVIQETVNGDTA